jgi:hypothetical protein
MINRNEVADYINGNMETVLTAEEIKTLEDSIKNHPNKTALTHILIDIFGDVSMLTAIRDGE